MKKIILALFTISLTSLTAQVKTPQPSPLGTNSQKVGMTTVSVEYSRPSVKGRTIFGDLVPYGKIWRTGANANTKITIDTEITVDGQELKAGTYALYTKPNKDSWEIFFYSDSENWGNPQKWEDAKVAAKTSVKSYPVPFNVETMAIGFNEIKGNSAHLELIWEKTYVAIPFEVPTDRIVMASIESTMEGEPKANDYYAAAVYYLNNDKDIKLAQKWIDKAVKQQKKKPKFWVIRQQSLIHAKAGDTKGAIKAAKKSLELAQKANNRDYINMNTVSLKEWEVEI
ncbi:DUF2911 domain-containing protein [Flavicella sp.]|uniref:DUF2911 domain-containing protein n=1 Tax=Flavicella sp. TaxID=2957742 RepID=UPI002626205D|nr:DUF2911 domain-containing protein [Flavicella sp.]MDG1803973.1 DUF2911 domain-containing protein [Flavicella sp.]MDG2280802.1 DUF2911 domain-containing protein [Flavicella sp.]